MARTVLNGRYQLKDEIGAGGMGTVYRAHDRTSHHDVAVKILHSHLSKDRNYVARFQREAQVALALDSRHTVRVLNFGEDNGKHYLVMDLVEGESLASALARGVKISQLDALLIGAHVARALEEAHSKGVIHRDIKPQNIMIRTNGDAVVADFGIVRLSAGAEFTATSSLFGSAPYLSPEALQGSLDERSDLYSLGVVLYECLAGTTPFHGATPFEVIRDHLEKPVSLPAEVKAQLDPAVVEIVESCLAKGPEARPQTAAELRETVEELIGRLAGGAVYEAELAGQKTSSRHRSGHGMSLASRTSDLTQALPRLSTGLRTPARALRGSARISARILPYFALLTVAIMAAVLGMLVLAFLPAAFAKDCPAGPVAKMPLAAVGEEHALAFQSKLDEFVRRLDAGESAAVTFTNNEVTSRTVYYLTESGQSNIQKVNVCLVPKGASIQGSYRPSDALGKALDLKAIATLTIDGTPRISASELKVGRLPAIGPIRSTVQDLVNSAFSDLEIEHRYVVKYDYNALTLEGEP
jgi:serine/threonine-protein kinase